MRAASLAWRRGPLWPGWPGCHWRQCGVCCPRPGAPGWRCRGHKQGGGSLCADHAWGLRPSASPRLLPRPPLLSHCNCRQHEGKGRPCPLLGPGARRAGRRAGAQRGSNAQRKLPLSSALPPGHQLGHQDAQMRSPPHATSSTTVIMPHPHHSAQPHPAAPRSRPPVQVICGIGYNGFPRGCADSELPWAKKSRRGDPLQVGGAAQGPRQHGEAASLCFADLLQRGPGGQGTVGSLG